MAGSALLLASAHPVQARVALWVAALTGFGLAAYPGRRHSLHVGATVVLSVLALVWMFGATLVWGTARSTQLRLPALAANGGLGWEWTALLILAVVGVASMGLALRYFTLARPRLGWPLTASAVACFGLWSLGVAYPVTAAVLAGAAGLAGLTLASGERLTTPGLTPAGGQHLITREPAHPPTPKTSQALGIVLLLAALFVGGGWVLEALTWLVVGPRRDTQPATAGRPTTTTGSTWRSFSSRSPARSGWS
jgi:hypothetical protein